MIEYCPESVDIYFDNVGGTIFHTLLGHMKHRGRIALCGAISGYTGDSPQLLPPIQPHFIGKELSLEGFMVWRWKVSG